MGFDKWSDVNSKFTNKVNYVLSRLNLEIKTINQIISKVENTSKHKYNQQYNQSKQYDQQYNQKNQINRFKTIQLIIRLE